MFWLRPGDTWTREFPTSAQNGSAKNADSTPTASLVKNGTVDVAVTVNVTSISTGLYSASCTIPSEYSPGDRVTLRIAATVDGVAAKGVLAEARLIAVDLATDIADQLFEDGGTNKLKVNDDQTVNTDATISGDDLAALATLINDKVVPNANQIAAALLALSCSPTIGVISPMIPGGAHKLVRGSAYLYDKGKSPFIKVPKADYDLSAATAELRMKVDRQTLVTAAATIISLDENFWIVYADLPSTKTDDLQVGTGTDQFWVTIDGTSTAISNHYLDVLEGLGVP